MGVILTAFLLDCFVTALAVVIAARVCRRFVANTSVRRRIVAFAGVAVFFGAHWPIFSLLWSTTVRQGENVAVELYQAIGPRLPPEASNITYHADCAGSDAVFDVSEAVFKKWANEKGWRVLEISSPQVFDLGRLGLHTTLVEGIKVSETFHPRGTGVDIVFDRSTGRCYFRYSAW
jgi:hypothetical protein